MAPHGPRHVVTLASIHTGAVNRVLPLHDIGPALAKLVAPA